ncbi:Uncharacterized membrane protein YhhN [Melghirimyces algeriensis]|uniref:Uncharacterized membrane protein YhhN n=2 Tax=Melghirimyces algeriensis TaxID=910412 RepID=A0A521DEK2_9BACL|nr:Uncharacterized membrane protein YhhN [Melghirimyces algeriensis]
MALFFLTAAGVSAMVYLWLALDQKRLTWKYILKPGTMLWVLALAVTGLAENPQPFGWLILVGLIFSVVGDVFLMLPSDRFIQGLIAFFVAHVCYVGAFSVHMMNNPKWDGVLPLLIVLAAFFFYLLLPGVKREGGRTLPIAVLSYILIISWMVWFAWSTGSLVILCGSLLFYISDAILAWNRFIHPLAWGEYGVMSTYFVAQILLAWSV